MSPTQGEANASSSDSDFESVDLSDLEEDEGGSQNKTPPTGQAQRSTKGPTGSPSRQVERTIAAPLASRPNGMTSPPRLGTAMAVNSSAKTVKSLAQRMEDLRTQRTSAVPLASGPKDVTSSPRLATTVAANAPVKTVKSFAQRMQDLRTQQARASVKRSQPLPASGRSSSALQTRLPRTGDRADGHGQGRQVVSHAQKMRAVDDVGKDVNVPGNEGVVNLDSDGDGDNDGSDNDGSDNDGSDNDGSDNDGNDNDGNDNDGNDNDGNDNDDIDNDGNDNDGNHNNGNNKDGEDDDGEDYDDDDVDDDLLLADLAKVYQVPTRELKFLTAAAAKAATRKKALESRQKLVRPTVTRGKPHALVIDGDDSSDDDSDSDVDSEDDDKTITRNGESSLNREQGNKDSSTNMVGNSNGQVKVKSAVPSNSNPKGEVNKLVSPSKSKGKNALPLTSGKQGPTFKDREKNHVETSEVRDADDNDVDDDDDDDGDDSSDDGNIVIQNKNTNINKNNSQGTINKNNSLINNRSDNNAGKRSDEGRLTAGDSESSSEYEDVNASDGEDSNFEKGFEDTVGGDSHREDKNNMNGKFAAEGKKQPIAMGKETSLKVSLRLRKPKPPTANSQGTTDNNRSLPVAELRIDDDDSFANVAVEVIDEDPPPAPPSPLTPAPPLTPATPTTRSPAKRKTRTSNSPLPSKKRPPTDPKPSRVVLNPQVPDTQSRPTSSANAATEMDEVVKSSDMLPAKGRGRKSAHKSGATTAQLPLPAKKRPPTDPKPKAAVKPKVSAKKSQRAPTDDDKNDTDEVVKPPVTLPTKGTTRMSAPAEMKEASTEEQVTNSQSKGQAEEDKFGGKPARRPTKDATDQPSLLDDSSVLKKRTKEVDKLAQSDSQKSKPLPPRRKSRDGRNAVSTTVKKKRPVAERPKSEGEPGVAPASKPGPKVAHEVVWPKQSVAGRLAMLRKLEEDKSNQASENAEDTINPIAMEDEADKVAGKSADDVADSFADEIPDNLADELVNKEAGASAEAPVKKPRRAGRVKKTTITPVNTSIVQVRSGALIDDAPLVKDAGKNADEASPSSIQNGSGGKVARTRRPASQAENAAIQKAQSQPSSEAPATKATRLRKSSRNAAASIKRKLADANGDGKDDVIDGVIGGNEHSPLDNVTKPKAPLAVKGKGRASRSSATVSGAKEGLSKPGEKKGVVARKRKRVEKDDADNGADMDGSGVGQEGKPVAAKSVRGRGKTGVSSGTDADILKNDEDDDNFIEELRQAKRRRFNAMKAADRAIANKAVDDDVVVIIDVDENNGSGDGIGVLDYDGAHLTGEDVAGIQGGKDRDMGKAAPKGASVTGEEVAEEGRRDKTGNATFGMGDEDDDISNEIVPVQDGGGRGRIHQMTDKDDLHADVFGKAGASGIVPDLQVDGDKTMSVDSGPNVSEVRDEVTAQRRQRLSHMISNSTKRVRRQSQLTKSHEMTVENGKDLFRGLESDLVSFIEKQDESVERFLREWKSEAQKKRIEVDGDFNKPWAGPKVDRLESRVLAMKEVVQLRLWETMKGFASSVSKALIEENTTTASLEDVFISEQAAVLPEIQNDGLHNRTGKRNGTGSGGTKKYVLDVKRMGNADELKAFVGDDFKSLRLGCYKTQAILKLCAVEGGRTTDFLYDVTPIGKRRVAEMVNSMMDRGLLECKERRIEGSSKPADYYYTPREVAALR